MPTGQTIINNALTILGILEQSGTPGTADSAAALNELNSMWDAWGMDEGLIYAIQSVTKVLTAATASYTIGTGAVFSTQRPQRLYQAFITNAGNRNQIKIVDALTYYAHRDLGASAVTPDEVYLDFLPNPTTGFATIYLWPVNSGTPTLELETAVNFVAWALAVNYLLPYGYQDAIQYALAFRLIPQYGGIVAPQVAQTVMEIGSKAELRIRTMNSKNRQLPESLAALEPIGVPNPQQQPPMTPRV